MANVLHVEGAELLLQCGLNEEATPPASFYIMLMDDTPEVADTLADLVGEPVGGGYARQAVASDVADITVVPGDTYAQATLKKVTFTATADGIGPVSHAALVTAETGTEGLLVMSWSLTSPVELADGDSLEFVGKLDLASTG